MSSSIPRAVCRRCLHKTSPGQRLYYAYESDPQCVNCGNTIPSYMAVAFSGQLTGELAFHHDESIPFTAAERIFMNRLVEWLKPLMKKSKKRRKKKRHAAKTRSR